MIDKRSEIFKEDQVRIRQLQRMIGDGNKLSLPVLAIIIFASIFSIITNTIVGTLLDILPAAIGVLVTQTILVSTFLRTDAYDRLLARAVVLLYVAFYVFIVLAVEPNYNVLFVAMLGFPQFTVLVMGSREGTFWSVITLAFIGGGALYHGFENDIEIEEFAQIIYAIFQTLIVMMFVYVIDVVARRYAQQLLSEERSSEESQAQYGVLLDSVTEGLIAVDRQGIVQFVNKAATRLTGLSQQELEGSVVASTVLMADSKEAILRAADYPVNEVLSTVKTVQYDQFSSQRLFMIRKDGTRFQVGLTVSPVQVQDENIGALMVFHDLTETNATEKAKSEFVSLASHQLRTPLNVVSWYAQKLAGQKKGGLNEHQDRYVREIRENNQRMISIVSDLLNVSRVDLGRVKIQHETVEFTSLVNKLCDEVTGLAEKKNIAFSRDLPQKGITFKDSDNNLVTVIVQNILSNAIKYTQADGRVSVNVDRIKRGVTLRESHSLVASKDGILIKVKDTGIGIPDSQKEKIFTKLFRADNVESLDVEGTGLGLYVTRSFVNELNGEIWFESKQGTGTTFFVYIPE